MDQTGSGNRRRTVLITGASRGIGRATAEIFALSGYNVAVNFCHSEKEARALARGLQKKGCAAVTAKADVSDRGQVDEMVSAVTRLYGGIDVLVNNAGIAGQKLFTEITGSEWDEMFAVDVKGVFNCSQAVLPGMIHNRAGCIVNISSIWGLVGASCETHYSAAKAAVIGLTKALAKELGPSRVRVNCVAPGIIDTRMNAFLDEKEKKALIDETPLMAFGKPEDVAKTVYFLAGEDARFITGQVISPNGGFVI